MRSNRTNTHSWDRFYLQLSSQSAEPLCQAFRYLRFRLAAPLHPNLFENCSSRTKEIAFRSFLSIGTFFACITAPSALFGSALILGVVSKLLRLIGYMHQSAGFTYVKTSAPESSFDPLQSSLTIVSWNQCAVGGGLSIDHGGVVDWRVRINGLANRLVKANPDVMILQEHYDAAVSEALVKKMGDTYPHAFTHIGPNVWGSESGLFVMSKLPIHSFEYIPFKTNDWSLNRGFVVIEIKASTHDTKPLFCIIGTHLKHGNKEEDESIRSKQINQIVEILDKKEKKLPTFLAGDLNIDRGSHEEKSFLSALLEHSYLGEEETCTNRLVGQWKPSLQATWGEKIDYISLFKKTLSNNIGAHFKECLLIRAFDASYNTKTALSDHHGIVAKIQFNL